MTRRSVCIATLAGAALVLAAPAAAGVRVTPLRSVAFPDRAYVLATSSPVALGAGSVRVLENGRLVDGVTVVPASASASHTFGVVLVIDASRSMDGAAIRSALSAARAFATHKTGAEAIGVMVFNARTHVLVRPTTRLAQLRRALETRPALAEGTYLYDAAARAVALLAASKITAGSVVLLTDGTDTGSRLSAAQLVKRAHAADVRIFSVGLRSKQFAPSALRRLADLTGGSYTEASSAASLARIYSALSRRLASEYLVRYRSTADSGTNVSVEISIAGAGTATSSYRTVGVPSGSAAPIHRPLLTRFVDSNASVLLVSLLAALLAAWGVSAVFRGGRSDLPQRIDAFSTAGPEGPAVSTEATTARPFEALERALAGRSWWERLKDDLDIAGVTSSPVSLLVGTSVATFVALLLLATISILLTPLCIAIPLIARAMINDRMKKRRVLFGDQLPDNLLVLAASLRAGHSFVGAFSAVLEEAEEPSRSELGRAVADERLGVPVEEALIRVSHRMANPDLEQVALVASLQRETGGNTAEVLDTVVATVRERFEVRRLVQTLTAQGRLSKWILTFLPLGVVGIVVLFNPTYIEPLFTTTTGHILILIAVALQAGGFVVIRRILDVEI